MIDTTCDQARTLHFAQANFKYNFDVVNIESDSPQLQEYKAPGSFGEEGDERKYSFLMFDNPNRRQISELKLPGEGEAFDVDQFRSDNGFEDAVAGVGMVVTLGGTANCDADPSDENDRPESSSAAEPKPSSSVTPSAAVSSSAAVRTSSPVSRASSSPAGVRTTEAQEPESTAEPSETPGEEDSPSPSTEDSSSATDLATEASSVLLGPASTILVTTTLPETTISSTSSSTIALQTDSGASGLSTVMARCMVAAFLVAFAGLWV
ncbi:hypothetical protein P154DRAFT_524412 [Amniculicola lignicola CBS 123094]|uniref:Uncharacterized protein n=1 Tax=Amniculicola lignicola CBS 123094 TaxID=1392246 RepID=A0A6A5WCJ0_9PLEO|nr:hypothetical protein P154DRAFT_524412 [Amniculicola lignicola CBS 123094]